MWFPNQHHSHNSVWPRPTRLWCSNLQDKRSSVSSPCELFGKKSSVRRSFSSSRLASFAADSEGRFLRSQSMFLQHGDANPGLMDRDSGFLGACGNNDLSLDSCENDPDALERWRNAGLALHRMLTKKSPCKQSRSGHSRKRSKLKVEFPNGGEHVSDGNKACDIITTESSALDYVPCRRETNSSKGLRTQSFQDFCTVQKTDRDIDSFLKVSFRQRLLSSSPELEKMFPKMFESLTGENTEVFNSVICQSPKDIALIPEFGLRSLNESACSLVEDQLSRKLENSNSKSLPRPTSLAIANTNTHIPSQKSQDFIARRSVLPQLDSTHSSEGCECENISFKLENINRNLIHNDEAGSDVSVNTLTTQTDSRMSCVTKPTCTESSIGLSLSDTISESTAEHLLCKNTDTLSDVSYAGCRIKSTTQAKSDNVASRCKNPTQSESDNFVGLGKKPTQTKSDNVASRCKKPTKFESENFVGLGKTPPQADLNSSSTLRKCSTQIDSDSEVVRSSVDGSIQRHSFQLQHKSAQIHTDSLDSREQKSDQKLTDSFQSCDKKSGQKDKNNSEICKLDLHQFGICNRYVSQCICSCALRESDFDPRSSRSEDFSSTNKHTHVCESGFCAINETMLTRRLQSSENQHTSPDMELCNTDITRDSFNNCLFHQSANCDVCNNCSYSDLSSSNMNRSQCSLSGQSRQHFKTKPKNDCVDRLSDSQTVNSSNCVQRNGLGLDGFRTNINSRNCGPLRILKDESASIECSDAHPVYKCENCGQTEKLDNSRQHSAHGDGHMKNKHTVKNCPYTLDYENREDMLDGTKHHFMYSDSVISSGQKECSNRLQGHANNECDLDTNKQSLTYGNSLPHNDTQNDCSNALVHQSETDAGRLSLTYENSLQCSRQNDCSNTLVHQRETGANRHLQASSLLCNHEDCSNNSLGQKECSDKLYDICENSERELNTSKHCPMCGCNLQGNDRQTDCTNKLYDVCQNSEHELNTSRPHTMSGHNGQKDCLDKLYDICQSSEHELSTSRPHTMCECNDRQRESTETFYDICQNREHELNISRQTACINSLKPDREQQERSDCLKERLENNKDETNQKTQPFACRGSRQSQRGQQNLSNELVAVQQNSKEVVDSRGFSLGDVLQAVDGQNDCLKDLLQFYEEGLEKASEIISEMELNQSLNSSSEKCLCMCERCQIKVDNRGQATERNGEMQLTEAAGKHVKSKSRETSGGSEEMQSREATGVKREIPLRRTVDVNGKVWSEETRESFQRMLKCRENKGFQFSDRSEEFVEGKEIQTREISEDWQSGEISEDGQAKENISYFQSVNSYLENKCSHFSERREGRVAEEFQSRERSGNFTSENYAESSDFQVRDECVDEEFQPRKVIGNFQSVEKCERSADFQFNERSDGNVDGEFQQRETITSTVDKNFPKNVSSLCKFSNPSNCMNTNRNNNSMITEMKIDPQNGFMVDSNYTDEDNRHNNLCLQEENEELKQVGEENTTGDNNLYLCNRAYWSQITVSDEADCDSTSDDGCQGNHCCCMSDDSTFCEECSCVARGGTRDRSSQSDGKRLRRKRRKKLAHGRKMSERKNGSTSSSCEAEQNGLSDNNHECTSDIETVDPFSNTMLQLYFSRGQLENDKHEIIESKESQASSTDYDKSFSIFDNSLGLCASGSLELSPLKDIFSNPLSPSQLENDFTSVLDGPSCDVETSMLLDKGADNSSGTGVDKIDRSESAGSVSRMIDEIFSPFEAMIGAQRSDASDNSSQSDKVGDFFRAPDFDLPSSDSGDADDEFECDCEHCQLVRVSSHPDQLASTLASVELTNLATADTQQIANPWEAEWVFSGDNNFDVSLDDFRPLEPFLQDLQQQLPQDPIELMYQNVIMQMLTVHPELLGELAPPPVSLTVIDSLEVVIASKDNTGAEMKCPICLCWFDEGEELTQLPCQHLYHPLCIQAWLVKSGTCPVCRHVLQPDL